MKVKCLSTYPTDQQMEKMGDFYKRQAFGLTVGKEYVVLGIMFLINSLLFGTSVVIQFQDDDGNLGFAPLILFKITDGRPSRYWEAQFDEEGSFRLQPSSFYQKYYNDDLSNGVEGVVKDFNRVRGLFEAEDAGI